MAPVIACVLRSGGIYKPEHVERLQAMVGDLVCLSDIDVPCERIPLKHDWPGWWGKIELFRPIWNAPVVYLDLDVTVKGSMEVFVRDRLTLATDFLNGERANSSVMAWTETPTHLYETFADNPGHHMARHRRWPNIGDQSFIESQTTPDRFPREMVASYRRDGLNTGAPVVAYHGKPKPWDT